MKLPSQLWTQAPPSTLLTKLHRQLDRHINGDTAAPFQEIGAEINLHVHPLLNQKLAPARDDKELPGPLPLAVYTEDGHTFDVHNIPKDQVVGDVKPSVWAGVEQLNQQKRKVEVSTIYYANAQAQTKKALHKLGMLD